MIAGGKGNCIDSATPSGASGPFTPYNTIGGGQTNMICAATNHSSILGGSGNTVSGNCSAILGGSGNNDDGNPFTGIFGTGISATPIPGGAGGLWVNELVLPNIPRGNPGPVPPPLYPAGSLWYYPDSLGNKVVYVVWIFI